MKQFFLKEVISEDLAGLRLDQALAKLLPQFSRSEIQRWVLQGKVSLDHKPCLQNKVRVFAGQIVALNAELAERSEWQPEQIPLDIVFEDKSVFVINKPAGLIVHPGAGNPSATLVNALLHYDPGLKQIPRAGLIHRLDKDTSGLLLVARTPAAHHFLVQQMQARAIHRCYRAIVVGHPKYSGTIDLPIGRHPTQRTKMAIVSKTGKPAKTHYRVLEKFSHYAYVEIVLETGRTHQIRVHMAHIKHAILGDRTYGKTTVFRSLCEPLCNAIANFQRQALHAIKISFTHPENNQMYTFDSALPQDFEDLLLAFKTYDNQT
jgi:23S rRNA pseudouridine1911/1915/1917 synthase